ncbi:hypothetical protein [Methylogaea oryzae]|uniref:Uncharacterized protein n=1 Tax=Methylogaea oryzae TaxID=1295382 RepID=A0A8D4VN00_9GAMM|nr:hypothetical protein [Methylogaea oryzae]BBL70209.1 hypothetical protein MoryE10_08150 [Methylogaea oryzae]
MQWVIDLLIVQGLLGAFDVFWHHEWQERLPTRANAKLEQKIHGARELFYAVVFLGLAWCAWHGWYAWLLAAVIALEVALTAWDFVEEDRSRRLRPSERVTHLILSINGGAYLALLFPHWLVWRAQPTALAGADFGWQSWLLSLMGVGVFVWGLRDLWSGLHTPKQPAAAETEDMPCAY